MRRSIRAAALAVAAAVGACAPAAKPIVLAPPAAAPPGTDGRYRGTVRLVRAEGATCPRSGARVLEVSGGQVRLSYSVPPRQRVQLTAQIDGDGRIQASDGEGMIDGQLTGGRLEITIASRQCEHRWTLNRVEG